jgi:hypothetical protein
MSESKPNAKPGKRPSGNLEGVNVALGLEKAPESKSEVSGHISHGGTYVCWNDGCANFVPPGWVYFICRCCGALNNV